MDMVRKGVPVLGKTHTDSWIGMHDDGKTIHTSTRGDSGFTADCTKHSVETVNNRHVTVSHRYIKSSFSVSHRRSFTFGAARTLRRCLYLYVFVVLVHATLLGAVRGFGSEASLHAACDASTGGRQENIGWLQDVLDRVIVVAVAFGAGYIRVRRKRRQLNREKLLFVSGLLCLLGLGFPWTLRGRFERPAILDGPLDLDNPR